MLGKKGIRKQCTKQENPLLFEMLNLGIVVVREGVPEEMSQDLKDNIGVKWGERVRQLILDKGKIIHMSFEARVADRESGIR